MLQSWGEGEGRAGGQGGVLIPGMQLSHFVTMGHGVATVHSANFAARSEHLHWNSLPLQVGVAGTDMAKSSTKHSKSAGSP